MAPAVPPVGGERTARRRRSLPPWWPVVVPVVMVLVGAWLYRWVDEDAFIDFRVVHNLLAGHGPVFNVGERVEVDSDPLWVATLAVVHGATPFFSLAWTSVVLGLVCTAGGFAAGGLAVVRLGASRGEGTVLPLGLLVASAVAGLWEFATSGLEMSMVFLWLGCSYLLLVRFEARRKGAVGLAVVAGLGALVRPELVLGAAVLLATVVVLVVARERPGRRFRTAAVAVVSGLAAPVAYELFRAAYYALLEPSTGLAKAAAASWWSQGIVYLGNLVGPYLLWIPAALAVPLVAGRAATWWRAGDRAGVLVLVTPLAVGALDVLYIVRLGGDYMHARLLLPGLFALCLPVYAVTRQLRTWLAVPVAGIAVWAVVCAGWLRFHPPHLTRLGLQTVFISNERDSWVSATGRAHPVTAADYARALSGQAGAVLSAAARSVPPGRQELVVVTDPFAPIDTSRALPARSPLPFSLAVNLPAIGVIGYLAGPRVYVYDEFSLANPIGSHTVVTHRARPGHEKYVGPSWMLGRFGLAGATSVPGGPSPAEVAAAREALGCDPLAAYLRAITAPWTPGRALSDLGAAWGFTRMRFSADPTVAVHQLCGHRASRPWGG